MTAYQPDLAIFEFGLEFLVYVHISLTEEITSTAPNNQMRAAWALTGAAVSFGASIRSLLISGNDAPARALLRTYVEALFLCIAVLHNHTLAQDYTAAQSPEQVIDFWHKKASPKNLHNVIIEI